MPTPARTSTQAIIAAGRMVLAREGLDGLTMEKVAAAAGVRAPSLYKRLSGRPELVRLVAADVVAEVPAALAVAASNGDPASDLRAMAYALRDLAVRDPHGFGLLFQPLPAHSAPDAATYAAAVWPLLRVTSELAGPDHALAGARTVTAWASGFLRMGLAGGVQPGEGVSGGFAYGITLLTDAIARQGGTPSG